MIQLKFKFVILTLVFLYQLRDTKAECRVSDERPGTVHGPAQWRTSTYQCWYIGPTDVTCSGDCGGSVVTTIPEPQNLASRVDMCSCCHTEIVLVTEEMFHCEFRISGLDDTPSTFLGNYYSFEQCSCNNAARRRLKRDENSQEFETQRGNHCQELTNTIFTSECQRPEDPVTVCWSKTRPVVNNPFVKFRIGNQMKNRMETEDSGSVVLPRRLLRYERYEPRSWDFPDEIFRTNTTKCCKAFKDPDCVNVTENQCMGGGSEQEIPTSFETISSPEIPFHLETNITFIERP